MKAIIATISIILSLLSSPAFAFADQGPNNEGSYDRASECDRDTNCMRAVQQRMSQADPNPYGWIWLVVIAGAFYLYIKK